MEISEIYDKFLASTGVCTDTRKLEKDCIFFALKGANFNGNKFAKQALESGAKYAIIDESEYQENESFILVENVLKTLQDLAIFHRQQFKIPFIAIGGSNGKTTSKELMRDVLSQKYNTFATPGNLNNHIGVPLSLLQIPKNTEIAIIEIGANHEGEIAELCEIAKPNYGIITNIGKDHLEGFGSLEGVARANSELYLYLLKNKGKIFVNSRQAHLQRMASRFPKKSIISYPAENDFFEAELLDSDFFVNLKTPNNPRVKTQLFGSYNFDNIVTALCMGVFFEVKASEAEKAVSEYSPQNQRSEIIPKRSNTIILDAYNANPSSMELAIDNFAQIKAEHKVLIIGDMYELGNMSKIEHEKIGKQVSQYNFDILVFYGQEIQVMLRDNPKAYYFPDKFSLHNWIQDRKFENTHFLIKGSRGVKLETVLGFI